MAERTKNLYDHNLSNRQNAVSAALNIYHAAALGGNSLSYLATEDENSVSLLADKIQEAVAKTC